MFTTADLALIEIALINRLTFIRQTEVMPHRDEKIERITTLIDKVRATPGDDD